MYPERYLLRRFQRGTKLFQHIFGVVSRYDNFFVQKKNFTGLLSHSTLQNLTTAICIMAYRIPTNLVDCHLEWQEARPSTVRVLQVYTT
jgi:hypothetical protein